MSEKRKDNKGRILKTGESQRKSDGRYQFRYNDRNGKRKMVYALTLQELREKEKYITRDLDDNIDIEKSQMTLNELFQMYMETKTNLKDTTRLNYTNMWKHNITNSWIGNKRIHDIKKIDIKKLYSEFNKRGLSGNTIKYLDTIISASLQLAVDSDIIRKNPTKNCAKEYLGDEKERYSLTIEQQKNFLDFILHSRIYNVYYPMIVYMLGTGCRVSEMAGLSWSKSVELKKKIIHIDHQLIYKNIDGKTKFHIISPKTDAGKRNIPMTDAVYHALLEQKKQCMETGNFCKIEVDGYDDFVFTTKGGKPLSASAVNFILENMVNAYNKLEVIKAENEKRSTCPLPHISSHILRHTACTRMAEAGIDLKSLQYIMGHSSVEVTMAIYNHVDMVRVTNEMKKAEVV